MTAPRRVNRLLVVRNDRIGDLILTLPVLEAARQAFPGVYLAALVGRYTAPLASLAPSIDEVLVDEGESVRDLAKKIEIGRFDAALVINTNRRNCSAVLWAGVPCRVTWGHKLSGILFGNRRIYVRRSHPPIHESNFALAFLRRLAPETSILRREPRLEVPTQTRLVVQARVEKTLGTNGPLFGVHPGNGSSAFNWPPDYYCRLVRRLAAFGRVLITGVSSECRLLKQYTESLPPAIMRRVAVFNDWTLPELTAALDMLDVLTVSSTGPMHLAAAMGTPVVALFSPHPVHHPLKWAPLGKQHVILVPALYPGEKPANLAEGGRRMGRITLDQVLLANLNLVGDVARSHRTAVPKPDQIP
jgi:ADP-heptose:LPS heptosyltransferase